MADAPLPEEVQSSLDWIASATSEMEGEFWVDQLDRVDRLVRGAQSSQFDWDSSIAEPLRLAGGKVKVAALRRLMSHSGSVGDMWVSQLIFGFSTTGLLSQEGVAPHSENVKPPIAPSEIRNSSAMRLRERAARSGFKNAAHLRGDSVSHVASGMS